MSEFTKAAQALSDETRVRILNLIMSRECCVCEVMQALEISLTRASRNLKILYDAGFLSMRTDGLFTLYSITPNKNDQFHSVLLTAVQNHMNNNPYAEQDLAHLKEVWRIGANCLVNLKEKTKQVAYGRNIVRRSRDGLFMED
jgi:ArsR family transcriptional regulator